MSGTGTASGLVRLPDGPVVCWHGPVDDHAVPVLRGALLRAAQDPGTVVFAAGGVGRVGGAGLAVLARTARDLDGQGRALRLAAPPAHLADLLVRTGLHSLLTTVPGPPPGWADPCRRAVPGA